MAKPTYAKLGLKTNLNTNELIYGEQSIEVKEYLPIEDKMEIIQDILDKCNNYETKFYNPGIMEIYLCLNIVYKYTNLSFTEKQKENALKLYNTLVSSGFYNQVLSLIKKEEIDMIKDMLKKSVKSIYKYKNSIMGLMEAMTTDYSAVDMDVTDIQNKLTDPEALATLKQLAELTGFAE